jgi:hypothetical protein
VGAAEALGGCLKNALRGAVRVGQHFAVPEAHNHPALRAQELCSVVVIGLRIEMLAAVELNREFCLATDEVDDERTSINWRVKAGR